MGNDKHVIGVFKDTTSADSAIAMMQKKWNFRKGFQLTSK